MSPLSATLLAIDDQPDNLALLEAFLESQGLAVRTALDGPTGLRMATESVPDLVLLDLAMPGMDGFEVLERLRAEPRTARVPVIILTANYREAAMIERGFRLGATEYLTKPIQMEELAVRVRSALRLAATERELARLRQDFSSMLVHDLRAPLDGVRLALGALSRQETPGTGRAELFAQALGALKDMSGLIDQLLQVNRLEDEGFQAQFQTVALAPLLDESVRALRPIAAERGLTLDLALPETKLAVRADAKLLRRTVDNLLSNALKFTQAGRVALTVAQEGEGVRIAIADTGPGIPAEELPRLFDRNFHVARRRERPGAGFGLGLAFCERAVAAMGGKIGVESELERGSTFWIALPAAQ
ncbi:MAG TPA: HAMP domain-containing sensor histidine kinase [Oscillatoriaceae cyanobacterium]